MSLEEELTENQLKVMSDKYLRGDNAKKLDSPEKWLRGVAHNVALAELFYDKRIEKEKIFEEISYNEKNNIIHLHDVSLYEDTLKYFYKGVDMLEKYIEKRDINFKKYIKNLEKIAKEDEVARKIVSDYENKFYNMMSNFEFLPNSPTLMNAGRRLQQLSACFVLPIRDSIVGWGKAIMDTMLIHKSGGGTGFSASRVRPNGDEVKSTHGIATGPLSPLQIIDKATEVIKQGGKRRGANMGILRVDHPDIRDFITAKNKIGELENFNISVALTDGFMEAVEKNSEYELINPKNKEVVKKESAKEIFDLIVENAHAKGDPGIIFIDRMDRYNPTPSLGEIESTNPCIVGDSLVSTENGLIKMKKLVEEYGESDDIKIMTDKRTPIKVMGYNGDVMFLVQNQNIINLRSISRAFCSGVKPVYKLLTKSGFELDATADHKIFTINGKKKLIDIKPYEDKILIQCQEGSFNKRKELPFNVENEFLGLNGRRYKFNLPKIWSKELGQILGWLIGDGWLRSGDKNCRVGFSFGKEDKKILDYLKPIINSFYGKDIKEVQRENGVIHLSYHSKYVVEFFKKLGIKTVKADKKVVPELIFTSPKEAIVGFLQGLFSADGTLRNSKKSSSDWIALTSKSLKLLKQVQILLLNLGIKSRIFNRGRKKRDKLFVYKNKNGEIKYYASDGVLYELGIFGENIEIFREKIGFISNIKQNKLNNFRCKKRRKILFSDLVVSINFIGEKEVYDLTEPVTHSMICNSIVITQCGEQPLLPYESCNLGSISLSKFVENGKMNYSKLEECVKNSVRFLDDVIDMNNLPLPEIEEMTKGNRKIGLGIMGWAEALIKMGVSYNSKEGLKKGEEIMKFINETSLKASEKLAEERGVFPNYKKSIYDGKIKLRNATRTTIAPTGTIHVTAGLQGSGIEPFFSLVYTRYNAAALDALRKGKVPNKKDVFYEFNPLFEEVAEKNDWFGFGSKNDLWNKVKENGGSLKDIKKIPEDIQNIFVSAHDVSPEQHIKMQAAFQKYVDNAVSKTINFRKGTTIKEIEDAYMLAYKEGLKGVTIYVDKSKDVQVLNLEEKVKFPKDRPKIMVGFTRREKYGDGNKLYATKNYALPDDVFNEIMEILKKSGRPYEIFGNSSEFDPKDFTAMTAHGKAISKMLQKGIPIKEITKIYKSLPDGSVAWESGYANLSIEDALSKALEDHPIKENGDKEGNYKFNIKVNKDPCPNCGSMEYEIRKESGCEYYSCCEHSEKCG